MRCAECNRELAGKRLPRKARCRDCDPDGYPLDVPLWPRYSGDASKDFWEAVSGLKGEKAMAAYLMGCMLQDLESRVLRYVNDKRGRK